MSPLPSGSRKISCSMLKQPEVSRHRTATNIVAKQFFLFIFILFLGKFSIQPRARQAPVTTRRPRRNLQRLRDLFFAQAAKVAQFDYLTLSGIHLRQSVERVIERDHVGATF